MSDRYISDETLGQFGIAAVGLFSLFAVATAHNKSKAARALEEDVHVEQPDLTIIDEEKPGQDLNF